MDESTLRSEGFGIFVFGVVAFWANFECLSASERDCVQSRVYECDASAARKTGEILVNY